MKDRKMNDVCAMIFDQKATNTPPYSVFRPFFLFKFKLSLLATFILHTCFFYLFCLSENKFSLGKELLVAKKKFLGLF